eukprot:2242823-Prymnesium_polylepis.1
MEENLETEINVHHSTRQNTNFAAPAQEHLWVAQHGGCYHTTCAATGCQQQESQLHLIECPFMNRGFWEPAL